MSGNGYPYKLKAHKISFFGKITAITDCYDALTTNRPYKEALTPYKALDLIIKEKDSYDMTLVETYIKFLGRLL